MVAVIHQGEGVQPPGVSLDGAPEPFEPVLEVLAVVEDLLAGVAREVTWYSPSSRSMRRDLAIPCPCRRRGRTSTVCRKNP